MAWLFIQITIVGSLSHSNYDTLGLHALFLSYHLGYRYVMIWMARGQKWRALSGRSYHLCIWNHPIEASNIRHEIWSYNYRIIRFQRQNHIETYIQNSSLCTSTYISINQIKTQQTWGYPKNSLNTNLRKGKNQTPLVSPIHNLNFSNSPPLIKYLTFNKFNWWKKIETATGRLKIQETQSS